MPSLMPGMPGAKEAYGVSVIREDLKINIPPPAIKRYEIRPGDQVILVTGHRGEGGFGMLNKKRAAAGVFKKYIDIMAKQDFIYDFNGKFYVLTEAGDCMIQMNREMMERFHLHPRDRLLVVKSTTVAMSFTPVEIWKEKLASHGFHAAVINIDKLEVF